MREDPIVAEIHEIRAALLADFGGDIDAYYRHIQEISAEKRKRGIYYASLPARESLPRPDAA